MTDHQFIDRYQSLERWLEQHDRLWVPALALLLLVIYGFAIYRFMHGDAVISRWCRPNGKRLVATATERRRMKDAMTALSAAVRAARTVFTRSEAARLGGRARRNSAYTIGQLISALNDRNVAAALCLLEAPIEGSGNSRGPDYGVSTRRKCIGCGE